MLSSERIATILINLLERFAKNVLPSVVFYKITLSRCVHRRSRKVYVQCYVSFDNSHLLKNPESVRTKGRFPCPHALAKALKIVRIGWSAFPGFVGERDCLARRHLSPLYP